MTFTPCDRRVPDPSGLMDQSIVVDGKLVGLPHMIPCPTAATYVVHLKDSDTSWSGEPDEYVNACPAHTIEWGLMANEDDYIAEVNPIEASI